MYFSKLFKIVTAVLKSSFFIGYIVMIKETVDSKHPNSYHIYQNIKNIFLNIKIQEFCLLISKNKKR